MKKVQFERYNDGVVRIYRESKGQVDYFSKKNVKFLEELDHVVNLDFALASRREQDLDFAMQHDFTLSLKIKTRFCKTVDNKCKAVINDYLYEVAYVDSNLKDMWLYLQGVGKIDS